MITVKHCHGLFMVWKAEDVIRLRKEHRIVGNFGGAMPEYPRQNIDYGLPLMLMAEEVRLLAKLALVKVIDTSYSSSEEADHFRSEHCQTQCRQLQAQQYQENNRRMKETRKAEIEANLDRIVAGKVKKQGLKLEADELASFREKVHAELLASIKDLPANSNSLSRFYIDSPYPHSERLFQLPPPVPFSLEALKSAVFEHFWRKGYFLTDGLRFGAHFLAYDNDPIVFHSKFIVMCCPNAAKLGHFESTLVQAYGRLGKNVRKNVIIAHYDSTEGSDAKVVYRHLQWNSLI